MTAEKFAALSAELASLNWKSSALLKPIPAMAAGGAQRPGRQRRGRHAETRVAGSGRGPALVGHLHAEGRACELLRVEIRAEDVEAAGVGHDLAVGAGGAGHRRGVAVAPGDHRRVLAGRGVGIGVGEVEEEHVAEGHILAGRRRRQRAGRQRGVSHAETRVAGAVVAPPESVTCTLKVTPVSCCV